METLQNNNTENLSNSILKSLALLQHLGEDYFIHNDTAYKGTFEDAEIQYNEVKEDYNDFTSFCNDELEMVEDYTEDYNNDYLVLTDEEADEKAKEYILDSVWAFTPSFLSGFTGFDIEVFEAIQNNDRCESNNDAILSMIDDTDDFVSQAISADGRGHFMSSYDGAENEETIEGERFYIYRMN